MRLFENEDKVGVCCAWIARRNVSGFTTQDHVFTSFRLIKRTLYVCVCAVTSPLSFFPPRLGIIEIPVARVSLCFSKKHGRIAAFTLIQLDFMHSLNDLSYLLSRSPYHSPPYPHMQLEMPISRRRQQHHHRNGDGPSGAGNGHSSASISSSTSSSSTTARPAHTKVLRAKDASYSEGILQDFRREEIPTELAQFYDLQGAWERRDCVREGVQGRRQERMWPFRL